MLHVIPVGRVLLSSFVFFPQLKTTITKLGASITADVIVNTVKFTRGDVGVVRPIGDGVHEGGGRGGV